MDNAYTQLSTTQQAALSGRITKCSVCGKEKQAPALNKPILLPNILKDCNGAEQQNNTHQPFSY